MKALRDEQERWECEKRALVGKYMRAFQPSDHVEGDVVNMADRGVDNSGRCECEKRVLVATLLKPSNLPTMLKKRSSTWLTEQWIVQVGGFFEKVALVGNYI